MRRQLIAIVITVPLLALPGCANANTDDGQRIVGQMGVALVNAPLCVILGPGCIATGYALGTGVDRLLSPEQPKVIPGTEMEWPEFVPTLPTAPTVEASDKPMLTM